MNHAAPSPDFASRQLGGYTILHRLARGGMAESWLARTGGRGKLVVVQRVAQELSGSPDLRRWLEQEARLSTRLDHPALSRVLDYSCDPAACFVVTDATDGLDLATVLSVTGNGIALPIECVIHIMTRVCEALSHAHAPVDKSGRALRLVHGEISPRHVLVTSRGEVKVLGFGIARALNRIALTRAGGLRESAGYLAPEVVAGGEPDRRSDIFSATALCFELLTGSPLFDDRDPVAIVSQLCAMDSYEEKLEGHGLGGKAFALLAKGLRKSPKERFQTAAELGRAVQELARSGRSADPREGLRQFLGEHLAEPLAARRKIFRAFLPEGGDTEAKTESVTRAPGRGRRKMYLAALAMVILAAAASWRWVSF